MNLVLFLLENIAYMLLCVSVFAKLSIFWLYRGKQARTKAEADSKKDKERGEDGGGDGGGATAERRDEKKSQGGSKLPTIKHYPKHSP